ncbi:solute carrier family 40 member 1-like [Pteropus medius]|uniref:solute carrier family 40 member 1-like n=1 Tax=Pteropus vampyrus TaxID=132908 RepID=UPI00196B0B26|nr:solute carrier family 40 member 1-like [Pteropus giganteus]
MLVFSYKREMEQVWHSWFTVACYVAVITLAALANLASTALTITIERDWIVSLTGDNRGQLAVRRLDQIINIFAPLSVGQRKDRESNLEGQQATGFSRRLQHTRRLLRTWRGGCEAYCGQTVFLAGLGLAFLYMTVLGFDCITTGYAYTQGIGGSLLSILTALSALSGLTGTILFTRLRGHYGLVTTGIISSWLHVGCLTLCVFSVFAPGSPFDLAVFSLPLSNNSSSNHEVLKEDQVYVFFL